MDMENAGTPQESRIGIRDSGLISGLRFWGSRFECRLQELSFRVAASSNLGLLRLAKLRTNLLPQCSLAKKKPLRVPCSWAHENQSLA